MVEDHRQGLLPCTLIDLPHDNLLLLHKLYEAEESVRFC